MADSLETSLKMDEINRLLGRLTEAVASAERSRELTRAELSGLSAKIDQISEQLGTLSTLAKDLERLEHRVEKDVLPHIEEFKRLRATGRGVLVAVGVASGTFGAALVAYGERLVHLLFKP